MSLKDTLMNDLKTAMKEKDATRKSVITMLRSAVKQVEVDSRVELSDDEIISIVQKQVKQKRSAIDEFSKGGREDLVDEAKQEIEILEAYLPAQLSEEEITSLVEAEIAAQGASSMKDMGKVMGALKEKTAGRADGAILSKIVKAKLQ